MPFISFIGISLWYDLHGAQRLGLEVSPRVMAEHAATKAAQCEQKSNTQFVFPIHAASPLACRTVWKNQGNYIYL